MVKVKFSVVFTLAAAAAAIIPVVALPFPTSPSPSPPATPHLDHDKGKGRAVTPSSGDPPPKRQKLEPAESNIPGHTRGKVNPWERVRSNLNLFKFNNAGKAQIPNPLSKSNSPGPSYTPRDPWVKINNTPFSFKNTEKGKIVLPVPPVVSAQRQPESSNLSGPSHVDHSHVEHSHVEPSHVSGPSHVSNLPGPSHVPSPPGPSHVPNSPGPSKPNSPGPQEPPPQLSELTGTFRLDSAPRGGGHLRKKGEEGESHGMTRLSIDAGQAGRTRRKNAEDNKQKGYGSFRF